MVSTNIKAVATRTRQIPHNISASNM